MKFKCLYCKKYFLKNISRRKCKTTFCSRNHFYLYLKNQRPKVKCIHCGIIFNKNPSDVGNINFCSRQHCNLWKKSSRRKRFIGFIKKSDGCWLWKGRVHNSGYGAFLNLGLAHRYSYNFFKGEIPKGKHVLHDCDIKLCVNPDHLKIGDDKQNGIDRKIRNRLPKGENHKSSKLKLMEVIKIRKMLSKKISFSKIAKKFNVCYQSICNIKNGKTWATSSV